MGSRSKIKKCTKRSIVINASSISSIAHVILFKNDKKFKVFNVKSKKEIKNSLEGSLEISWGWGNKNSIVKWNGQINLERGEIIDLQTCFRGIPKLAPNQKFHLNKISLINEIKTKNNFKIVFNGSFIFCGMKTKFINQKMTSKIYQTKNGFSKLVYRSSSSAKDHHGKCHAIHHCIPAGMVCGEYGFSSPLETPGCCG